MSALGAKADTRLRADRCSFFPSVLPPYGIPSGMLSEATFASGLTMKPIQKEDNPFDWLKTEVTNNPDFSVVEFAKRFSLSTFSAKTIWMSCPQSHENICRRRITDSKSLGQSDDITKSWLRRRYKLSEGELEDIFTDIWNNPSDQISTKFTDILNVERIADSKLTSKAKRELAELQLRYGTKR